MMGSLNIYWDIEKSCYKNGNEFYYYKSAGYIDTMDIMIISLIEGVSYVIIKSASCKIIVTIPVAL